MGFELGSVLLGIITFVGLASNVLQYDDGRSVGRAVV